MISLQHSLIQCRDQHMEEEKEKEKRNLLYSLPWPPVLMTVSQSVTLWDTMRHPKSITTSVLAPEDCSGEINVITKGQLFYK